MTAVRILTLSVALAGLAGCNKGEAPEAPKAEAPKAEMAAEKPAEKTAPAPAPAEAPAIDPAAPFEARAKAAAGTLKKTLMGALTAAMQAGPGEAVTACNTKAPAITAAAAQAGVKVGRTSQKVRNPDNAPAPWLVPLLEEYGKLPADQAKPRVVDIEGGGKGYVEPLYVGGLCVTCHGAPESLPAEVKDRLAALYPQDAAVGYAPGDFRGLVWVTGE